MKGDQNIRHCSQCKLNVYNFSEMSESEIVNLLQRTDGRVCARLYRRADGTILTADCPVGFRKVWKKRGLVAAVCFLVLSFTAAITFRNSQHRGRQLMGDVAVEDSGHQ